MTTPVRRRLAALTLAAAGLVLVPATAAHAQGGAPSYRQSFYGPTALTDCQAAGRAGRESGIFDSFQCVQGIPGSNLVTLLGYGGIYA
ncbi:hypothetical protein ACIQF6_00775 [Kitasatospora sp. NPDC092948]|uniref:hypothetical protein n=1 Tax=Kitasatospora sp. NPDC092948 TaxID=3364088 RepID=UPI0037F7AA35